MLCISLPMIFPVWGISYFACSRGLILAVPQAHLQLSERSQLVIIITEVNNLQLDEFLLKVHTNIQSRLADSFSSIRNFRLAGNCLSPLARYQRLREDIHEHRTNPFVFFPAVHLDAFFCPTHIYISKIRFSRDYASSYRQPHPG
jgi:hypothetical protein